MEDPIMLAGPFILTRLFFKIGPQRKKVVVLAAAVV